MHAGYGTLLYPPSLPLTVLAVARVAVVSAQQASNIGIVGTSFEVGLSGTMQIVCPRAVHVMTMANGRAGASEEVKAVSLAVSVITVPVTQ